jgi:hypothetical protein
VAFGSASITRSARGGRTAFAGNAHALHAASEATWLRAFRAEAAFGLAAELPIVVAPNLFPPVPEPDLAPYRAYQDACRAAGALLAPPELPFD